MKGVAVGQSYSHLSVLERNAIERMGQEGQSCREIAAAIGRNPSTVSRELRRGLFSAAAVGTAYKPYRDPRLRSASTIPDPVYVGAWAHHKAMERRARSHQPVKMRNDKLVDYVCKRLAKGWSPQLISGRARLEHGPGPMSVCPETIYAWIYSPAQRHRKLMDDLPQAHARRHGRAGRKTVRSTPRGRVPISERPEAADQRAEFGHWEGDSVVGKDHGASVRTEVERVSRYLQARIVDRLTADDALAAQLDMFAALPPEARRSTTCDNGSEHANHHLLKDQLGMTTYFAQPYHSWERGTNENRNGLIRRYWPKRTDFAHVSPQDLQDAIDEINNRPMAILGYLTPAEVFEHHLEQLTSTPDFSNECCTSG